MLANKDLPNIIIMSKTAALMEKMLVLFSIYALIGAFCTVLSFAAPIKAEEEIIYMQSTFLRKKSILTASAAYLLILIVAWCCHNQSKYKDVSFCFYWGKCNFYYLTAVLMLVGSYFIANALFPYRISGSDAKISTAAYQSIVSSVICLISLFNIYSRKENLMVGLKWVASLLLINNLYCFFWSAYVFLEISETLIGVLLGFLGCWLIVFIRIDVWLRRRFVKKREEVSLINGTDF